MSQLTRRALIRGGLGVTAVATTGLLAGCTTSSSSSQVGPTASAVAEAEARRRSASGSVVRAKLRPRPVTLDLGGRTVSTWAYGDSVPGPLLRATAGDVLKVAVDNGLATDTSVHWHGIALRNDMDGVPGLTQEPIGAGEVFDYEFTLPHPGTYFYHPHSGVQLDRGLYGVLVVDDPAEPGSYDEEWIVVLDDWIDGTGRTPDEVLEELKAAPSNGMHGGMEHMGPMTGGPGDMRSEILGGAGDVEHPYYLVNGRTPQDPVTLTGRPGQRVRIRIVNAGSDTAFRVDLGGHSMSVTHSDGFAVAPVETDALLIAMGERYDVVVTLGDGAFPLVASAEGKGGAALAVVRTGSGPAPGASSSPAELAGRVLLGTDLVAEESVRLPQRSVDRRHDLVLAGTMAPYRWTINGKTMEDAEPLPVTQGERVRLRYVNQSMMFHPMHLHGHTFGLVEGGARKDTVVVGPMASVEVEIDTDNPGQWATHCHNIYHAEAGMMTTVSYQA
ncbi:multicopper oxidase, type 3 [Nocardioides sp. CF8]|uniref:multicopper oxidase family protein n=1 Tax=Nocardioides sp. CF8 TaxID=110319 RepID=UPI00032F413A|nr:multicopper oxidase family protein [Nocardioides sp. CF8]EON22719.1 multicopper oxidase, type 3 [Nocardioides sp. CF8]